ncbi:MAG: nuclear transport factor 2 family protein [Proteobacteria bacterium]|nr:nuclear transport factor 2 family protein [Pseudomonadota bacterium]
MRPPVWILALVLAAVPAVAGSPPRLADRDVRAFMKDIETAAQARDVERLAAALSPDCRIELRTRIGGQERVTLMTREEYIEMLRTGYAGFRELTAYEYAVKDLAVTLEADGAATVVSHVTETAEFAGHRETTDSEETARVERRADGLRVVAVSALTTGR